jgi:hypothetical protein
MGARDYHEGNGKRFSPAMRQDIAIWPLLICLAGPGVSQAGEAYRGMLLYENNCHACHYHFLHYRPRRKARSLDDLQRQIVIWQNAIGLNWNAEDIADVATYLNRRYYRFPQFTP